MAYVIKDTNTSQYYRQRYSNGWYSENINHARLFSNERMALQTIKAAGHHVVNPGNRNLIAKEVSLKELP